MDASITHIIDALVLPPGGPLLLGLFGLLFWQLGFARKLVLSALLLLWLFSMPVTENLLMASLETYPALSEADIKDKGADAIVVLGSQRYLNAPEYGKDSPGSTMLMRVRYTAWLAKKTGLPVIPSGGMPGNTGNEAEARIYADILRDEFGIQVEDTEPRSQNTWENARYTAQLMKKLGLKKIFLVTDAAHMPRAIYAFEHNGIQPIPAPTGFVHDPRRRYSWLSFMPNSQAMQNNAYALHEYLGLLWYSLK
jgi:uncharacterized SAM-binding protein YcdF (DUF218 family)